MTLTGESYEIAVHDLGGEGVTPVVLAHATGMHGLVWQPLVPHLGTGFRCYSFDARGHGDSPIPAGASFDWTELADDILAVVERLALERSFGAGHSSGATAMLLAEQRRPGTFERLHCFEPAVVPVVPPLGRDPDSWLATQARRRRHTFASREEAYRHYASKPPFDAVDAGVLGAYLAHGFEERPDGVVALKCRPETEALVYEMATAHDCFARLGQVRCPVMVAWGDRTDPFVQQSLAEVAAALPRASTEEIPGAGHFGPLEAPRAVANSMRSFFLAAAPA